MPRLAQTRQNFRTSYPQDKLEFKLFPSPAELITLTTRVTSTLTIDLACLNSDYETKFVISQ